MDDCDKKFKYIGDYYYNQGKKDIAIKYLF